MFVNFFLLVINVSAKTVFFADFSPVSKKAVPDESVNDPLNYIPENPLTVWEAGFFGAHISRESKRASLRMRVQSFDVHALIQTSNLCNTSGYTPFPGVTDFKDGIIKVVVSFGDPDGFGIQFRKTSSGAGYMVYFGGTRRPWVALFRLPHPCIRNGECLRVSKAAHPDRCFEDCEIFGPRGIGFDMRHSNQDAYTAQIEVLGSSVKVWFEMYESRGVNSPPLIEFDTLEEIEPGGVGIWHESWGRGMINNILITDKFGYEDDPGSSLAVKWDKIQKGAWRPREEFEIYDIDHNGVVNNADIGYLRVMMLYPEKFRYWNGDLNGDGKVDEDDVWLVKQRIISGVLAAAPSLQRKRKKVGTWGALKRRYTH